MELSMIHGNLKAACRTADIKSSILGQTRALRVWTPFLQYLNLACTRDA